MRLIGIEAARAQLDRLTLTSRAFYNDQLGPFCRDLAALAGMECVLPMNTGVEAVETAIKVARRWGYEVKGVPEDQAQIVVMTNNFHGRTTTVISFSNDHVARRGFGPFRAGKIGADSAFLGHGRILRCLCLSAASAKARQREQQHQETAHAGSAGCSTARNTLRRAAGSGEGSVCSSGCSGSPQASVAITGMPLARASKGRRGWCSIHAGSTILAPVEEASRSVLRDKLYTAGELLRANQLTPETKSTKKGAQLSLFEVGEP